MKIFNNTKLSWKKCIFFVKEMAESREIDAEDMKEGDGDVNGYTKNIESTKNI